MRTLVIAEIGSCHDGDWSKVLRLLDAARQAGASIAKMQYWSSADRLADRRRVPPECLAIYRRYQVPYIWLDAAKRYCDEIGMELMATTYLPEDVASVAPFVMRFKVASFEARDTEFIQAHRGYDKSLIVSTGMMDGEQVDALIERSLRVAPIVGVLQCVSAYPAAPSSLSLSTIARWRAQQIRWRVQQTGSRVADIHVGFSDHTDPASIWTGALAVAAGAQIVEAHLKLDETDPENPDAPHAMTPEQFKTYVSNIRYAETCLGDGEKRLQECEQPMARYRVVS